MRDGGTPRAQQRRPVPHPPCKTTCCYYVMKGFDKDRPDAGPASPPPVGHSRSPQGEEEASVRLGVNRDYPLARMPGGRGWPTGTTSLTTRSTQDRTGEVEQPRGRDLGNCPCSAPSVRCTWGIALVHRPLRPPPPLPPGAEGEGRRDNRERSLVHCAPGGAEKARILPKNATLTFRP